MGGTDMIAFIVNFAVARRWFVLLVTAIATVIGAWALSRLPIDAVPDITNNQVQISARAPALSPEQVERQVAFPIETALAGIPGLEIYALAQPQRFRAGHRGLHRCDRHLFRPRAGHRTAAQRRAGAARGRRS
jgi:hypothetical protein